MAEKSITVSSVTKNHKGRKVVDEVSFCAKPGKVTAFLGPNGAGKSSTLRILLGLDHQNAGTADFAGQNYASLKTPLKVVGALFDGLSGNKSLSVSNYLKIAAISNGIRYTRIKEVLALVGLSEKSRQKLGELSLGEGQRLGIAAALLGDPQYYVFDEPTNGLDPSGIKWFRELVRRLANEGKTVLLSSHMLTEIECVADDVVIINHGKIVATGPLKAIKADLVSLEELFFELTEINYEEVR